MAGGESDVGLYGMLVLPVGVRMGERGMFANRG